MSSCRYHNVFDRIFFSMAACFRVVYECKEWPSLTITPGLAGKLQILLAEFSRQYEDADFQIINEMRKREYSDGSRMVVGVVGLGVSSASAHRRVCSSCGSSGATKKLSPCSRCRAAWYCGKECQLADWQSHKKGCRQAAKAQGE